MNTYIMIHTWVMLDNKANVTKSPKEAAIGVATLSGLTLYFLDKRTTQTIINAIKKKKNVTLNLFYSMKSLGT